MKIDPLFYRDGYKAVVVEPWSCASDIRLEEDIVAPRYAILRDGTILVAHGYLYDFASGAVDTESIRRASLAHDVLCQAISEGRLDPKWQKDADKLLKRVCLLDGMARLRAWWVYRAVRAYQKRKKRIVFDAHPVKRVG